MAFGGFLALLDDIASIMDDVAVMSKIAVQKTAGVAGDDLAVGAHQLHGLDPARELPIVWAVAKGSFVNKCVLVPVVLLLSAFWPAAIMPLMMVGGVYLCYEGFEKVLHALRPAHAPSAPRPADADTDALERRKIAAAIKTDAILSAEIVVIALSSVAAKPLLTQALVLCVISVLMTAGIYGLVGLIVKLDDIGLSLSAGTGARRRLGRGLLASMPYFMKTLSVVGTIAMFMVGGGILVHAAPVVWKMVAGGWTCCS